ncbi:TrkA family potassium uptake protein [uncultured Methanobacterium sp.]|uniref:potassium channel family protein n=1 Tax=uncultured Methanobacterium sp. TaxID=176306 RepID=UPI002AA889DE|nr:TrkA family potassium uptake protein [uncultured Methanobacterium sp.]
MYIVIVGAGRVGLNLASFLISDGHDVTIIENNKKLCTNASHELDAMIICGNGTDKKILDEANIGDANVFVAATGNDETNLLSCILVKKFNIPKVIARVSDSTHEEAFKQVGIDSVVNPEYTAATYLEKLIIRPKIADLVIVGKGNAELLDITVSNRKLFGRHTSEISPTKDFIISAIYENGDITIPDDTTILKEGCKISVLVKKKAVKKVEEMFTA